MNMILYLERKKNPVVFIMYIKLKFVSIFKVLLEVRRVRGDRGADICEMKLLCRGVGGSGELL